MNLPKDISTIIDSGLTFEQVSKYLESEHPIITQQEIANMTSLDQVLKGNDHMIIFTATNSPEDGHYQMIFINDGNLYFFDSYGLTPCQMIDKVEKALGKTWGQNPNKLTDLILESQYADRAFYNTIRYQSNNDNVATCCRYTITVTMLNYIYTQNKTPFDFDTFQTIMNGWKQKYKKSYDEIVSFFISSVVSK